jgi:hypothetical protein
MTLFRLMSGGKTTSRLPETKLLHLRAAALDQNAQNDDKQNAGNNPDKHGCIHFEFLLSY